MIELRETVADRGFRMQNGYGKTDDICQGHNSLAECERAKLIPSCPYGYLSSSARMVCARPSSESRFLTTAPVSESGVVELCSSSL